MANRGKPGRDHTFTVKFKDIDLTQVSGAGLIAYTDAGKLVEKWSLNALEGWGEMIPVDLSAEGGGTVRVLLPASKTAGMREKQIYVEPVEQVSDVDFGELILSPVDGKSWDLVYITMTAIDKITELS